MLQTVIVGLAVLLAAGYAGRRLWRTLRPAAVKAGCGDGCGCGDGGAGSGDWARS